MATYVIGYIVIVLLASGCTAFCVNRLNLSHFQKKLLFTAISAFSTFPALMPAATILAIPIPNILFIGLITYYEGLSGFMDLLDWFIRTWEYTLAGVLIMAVIYWIVAHFLFNKKNLSKSTEKPI